MIKYLGSKRTLIPHILDAVRRFPHARSVLDLFSGTSRVGHALKQAGYRVIANDHNAYAHALATCYVEADAEEVLARAAPIIGELNALADSIVHDGGDPDDCFTEVYCRRARYFHPGNGARIAAVRDEIDRLSPARELRAVLLTSLMEAADRVDSTTGVQMAFLKSWAPRARNGLRLRVPAVLPRARHGKGEAHCMDAIAAARALEADIAYVDPPYNQHSYLGNYHVWETLVRWDRPPVYGLACKREDCRTRRSVFNSRRRIREAMADLIESVRAPVLIVSFNNEGYLSREEMERLLSARGEVSVREHDYKRYVGAQIGIYSPSGEKVGRIGRLRNTEYLFTVAPPARVVAGPFAADAAISAPGPASRPRRRKPARTRPAPAASH